MRYKDAGVDIEEEEFILSGFKRRLRNNFPDFLKEKVKLNLDYFANIIAVGDNLGLAFCCDGVGTKIKVAEQLDKFNTIGIDCVAMNVNDLVCIGAKPIAMLDYIGINKLNKKIIEEIGEGLSVGAKEANIGIIGGETAQLKDLLVSVDLVGFGIGTISLDSIIEGKNIREGDILIGLSSNGIHANGLSLARKVCFDIKKFKINSYIPELNCTIGEELLKPTKIYSNFVLKLLSFKEINVVGMAHITGGGLLNLLRFKKNISFMIDNFPTPHPIFSLLKDWGNIEEEELFRVFNMGVGFCIVIDKKSTLYFSKIKEIAKEYNISVFILGYAIENNKKEIYLTEYKLIGKKNKFFKY